MAVLVGAVGYAIRGERRVGPSTRVEVVTEGILTRMLQDDSSLAGIGCVIFDEFHERSLNADLGLALCIECQQNLREDLRVLVMSAKSETVWNRRPGLVGLRERSGIAIPDQLAKRSMESSGWSVTMARLVSGRLPFTLVRRFRVALPLRLSVLTLVTRTLKACSTA